MTSDALLYYEQTLAARYERLWTIARKYQDDLDANGQRLIAVATLATKCDWLAARRHLAPLRHHISSAPSPPAEPSPEGSQ